MPRHTVRSIDVPASLPTHKDIMAAVSFAHGFANSSYRLFELDEPVLQELLKDDGSVSIKGSRNDEAVLCTADKTYTLRLAESSNVLLLAPERAPKRKLDDEMEAAAVTDGDAGPENAAAELVEVQASVSAHFEIIRSAPRTGGLTALLSARPYFGASDAESAAESAAASEPAATETSAAAATQRRLTLEELEVTVQASGAELRKALCEARALPINSRWCVLDLQLEQDIIEACLSLCVEHDWALSAVPVAECVRLCVAQFAEFDEASVRHCLRTHSAQAADAEWEAWLRVADLDEVSLDPAAISCFRARSLLSECDAWPKDKFLEMWADGLPSGHPPPDESHLKGLAIFFAPASADEAPMLQALPLTSLSLVPKERFATLFNVKRSWTLDELEPYVRGLVDPSSSTTKLVLQFARSVTANDGSVSYVSR